MPGCPEASPKLLALAAEGTHAGVQTHWTPRQQQVQQQDLLGCQHVTSSAEHSEGVHCPGAVAGAAEQAPGAAAAAAGA